jgi:DNA-binding MarR family transcriptional regulator
VALEPKDALALWHAVTLAGMARGQPDLTTRQMAVLLHVYLKPQPHTVRGLSATLDISKPAVTRALDRLGHLGFVRRKRDESDKRSILVQRTVSGSVFLREFADIAAREAKALFHPEAPPIEGEIRPVG